MNPLVLPKLVGREKPLLTVSALERAHFKMPPPVFSEKSGLGELFAALQTFVRFGLVVTGHVFDAELFVLESPVTLVADILPILIGEDVPRGGRLRLDLGRGRMERAPVNQKHLPVIEDDVTRRTLVLTGSHQLQMLHELGPRLEHDLALAALPVIACSPESRLSAGIG